MINRNPNEPCPTIIDTNRQVGANFLFGPRFVGEFYGQGQSMSPARGFKSWGGNLGAPTVGLLRGFNFNAPVGSKVITPSSSSGCNVIQQQPNVQNVGNKNQGKKFGNCIHMKNYSNILFLAVKEVNGIKQQSRLVQNGNR